MTLEFFGETWLSYWRKDNPEKIVKYFSETDEAYLKDGSFKFGSLISYRKGETHRTSEKKEGLVEKVSNLSTSTQTGTIDLGAVKSQGCFGMEYHNIKTTSDFNEMVFCSSIGPYSETHHRDMLTKNPDCTHYAQIDTEKFVRTLSSIIIEDPSFIKADKNVNLVFGEIVYGKVASVEEIVPDKYGNYVSPPIKPADLLKIVFTKPNGYEHEKEFRILIRKNALDFPPIDQEQLIVTDSRLASCIDFFGKI
ncbi:hypothetical protein Q4525_14735 [Shimia thalassica]|uniref:hypothetical protein n=1 Tax=Shimia thalassica TaxID=1715693 RepID=UPI001C084581|nr:hypothetical protein [Shimia thalassica]MBU2941426.1 hypothetical protein [Shimia thalassica]MDO6504193.1 hypothetical protein [Shimia thalassica]